MFTVFAPYILVPVLFAVLRRWVLRGWTISAGYVVALTLLIFWPFWIFREPVEPSSPDAVNCGLPAVAVFFGRLFFLCVLTPLSFLLLAGLRWLLGTREAHQAP
ncbi:MAG TPA: hypothetical protein VHL57_11615 [Flavobacteriales bacterium]|nr:hypothetical protein [Flavobacteriales bacterium]